MKYEKLIKYSDEKFRQITGVKRAAFEKILEILKESYQNKHKNRRRHSKLTIEEMLLSALEYLREYRTYAHIAASYGVDKSNIYRIIKWVENVLIKNGSFSLAGKKSLSDNNSNYKTVLIDVTESPIQRPQKNKNITTRERKNNIQ